LADDRRSTTLRIAEDAPEDAGNLAEQEARDDRENARTVGQAGLSDAEKKRLDFAERPIFHAQASKAVIQDAGVDDWTSIYDPQVEDPAAFEQIAQNNREQIQGDRLDEDVDNVALSREQADSQLEKRAINAAADGVDEAADQLREKFGYDDQQIEEIKA